MSPDDHYQDLKRIIAAVGGKARRITVIMPFLYESRQHKRTARESLDCALALQELTSMGVDNIITFDAHDPRVQNAIPLSGFEMISSGESVLEGAAELKARKAKRVFICATFGLFTNGLSKFDIAYEDGLIAGVLTTNLIYQTPELLQRPYYINCDMSKYIAYIIDTLNHDASISDLLNPSDRIPAAIAKYKAHEY